MRRRLPSLRQVTTEVRRLDEAWRADEEWEYAALTFCSEQGWTVEVVDSLFHAEQYGRELLGTGRVDPIAVARRLLAAARDGHA